MRVDPKHLQNCKRWSGSILQWYHEQNSLNIEQIQYQIEIYDKTSDEYPLDENEIELKVALEKTLDDHAQKT